MKDKVQKERAERLAEHIARQVFDLAMDYLPRIEKAGSESEKGEAKVSFISSWAALHSAPTVSTKMSFSSSTKDETEGRIDLNGQQEMTFDGSESERPAPLLITGEVLDADGWVSAAERLPEEDLLVEIEDVDSERFTGHFGIDDDFEGTVFHCADGGILQVEYIVRWRCVENEEMPREESKASA